MLKVGLPIWPAFLDFTNPSRVASLCFDDKLEPVLGTVRICSFRLNHTSARTLPNDPSRAFQARATIFLADRQKKGREGKTIWLIKIPPKIFCAAQPFFWEKRVACSSANRVELFQKHRSKLCGILALAWMSSHERAQKSWESELWRINSLGQGAILAHDSTTD